MLIVGITGSNVAGVSIKFNKAENIHESILYVR